MPTAETPLALKVVQVQDLAKGIRAFELAAQDGSELPAFTPGSHIRVQTPGGAVRKYSLCNGPEERNRYVIAVKREDTGRGGSVSLHEQVRVGDLLAASEPENAFPMAQAPKALLFIAGGIGITPILSMIRSLESQPPVPWKLYYLSRSPETTPFLDVLGRPEWKRNVVVHHDHGDADHSLDLWPVLEKANSASIHCCGPRGLMDAVRDMTGHWSPKLVNFESFNEGGVVRPDDQPFNVRLARSGLQLRVPVGQSILATLRGCGVQVAASCESGTCGSCRTRMLEGDADHRDMVLMPHEHGSQVMVCVSRARSPELVLDL